MKDFFLKMLSAVDPTVSASRFLSIVTVMTVLYTWALVSIYMRAMQDIPVGVYTFVGLIIAGSVGNKAFEKIQAGSTQTSTETRSTTTVGEKNDNNR
jgi:uncharacterized membrane-anchored protein YitT (DUF2179 family)